jgi:hypothetical protein
MRCRPSVLGRTSLAAVAGALILAASPAAFAQASPSQTSPNQTAPDQANPNSQANPDQAAPAQTTNPSSPMMDEQNGQVPAEKVSTKPATRVADPKTTLASATVSDKDGQTIGQVQSVGISRSGHATRIAVSLNASANPGKVVALRASELTYDANNNNLQSSLTMREIERQPSIQTP